MTPIELLVQRGAGDIAHPGGTLLGHLQRVADRLASYGAGPSLVAAGLMHAAYSTDGFDTALLALDERPLLQSVVGEQTEALVYRYGATTRLPLYRQLGQPLVVWTDRFTGASVTLDPAEVAPLVELTVANELDVVEHSPTLPDGFVASLRGLFARAGALLSEPARDDIARALAPASSAGGAN